ncbi:MAG: hypothetical protein ACOX4M_10060 [Acetivibrionales bacterium]|jgi:hypothetical protein
MDRQKGIAFRGLACAVYSKTVFVSAAEMMAARIRKRVKTYNAARQEISTDAGNATNSRAAAICLTIGESEPGIY